MFAKILRWLGVLVSTLFALSLLAVLLFRIVPVPYTPLMLIRTWDNYDSKKPINQQKTWVPLSAISGELAWAVMASEDQRFYEHYGFDFEAIEKVRQMNKVSKEKRGASTISQQVAKNVFLWPDRSWLRKGLEAYFTILIELTWPKERIMEVYLNCIEMGEGIFGAEAAARAYYGIPASKLNLQQAAAIAAALPNPRKWSPAQPNEFIKAKSGWIVRAVWQLRAEAAQKNTTTEN